MILKIAILVNIYYNKFNFYFKSKVKNTRFFNFIYYYYKFDKI